MNKVKFKLDTVAFRKEVLQADWMLSATRDHAAKIAEPNTHLKSFIGVERAKTKIYPNTKRYPS